MKLKQNIPLRVKMNNAPTLLKPHSDKDNRILTIPKTFERHLTLNPKSEYPKINLTCNNNSIKNNNNTNHNIRDDEKIEDLNYYNVSRTNVFNKNNKIVSENSNNSDSLIKSPMKIMVISFKIIIFFSWEFFR